MHPLAFDLMQLRFDCLHSVLFSRIDFLPLLSPNSNWSAVILFFPPEFFLLSLELFILMLQQRFLDLHIRDFPLKICQFRCQHFDFPVMWGHFFSFKMRFRVDWALFFYFTLELRLQRSYLTILTINQNSHCVILVCESNAFFEEFNICRFREVLVWEVCLWLILEKKVIQVNSSWTFWSHLGSRICIDFFFFFVRTGLKQFLCPFLQFFQILPTHPIFSKYH